MGTQRVTQKDIAEKAGVGRTTVTLALQDHPKIAPETKKRILEIARELGYQPDPFLSGLAAYRSTKRSPAFHGTIAWLVNSLGDYDWREYPHYVGYFNGASARATYHGYKLEELHLHTSGISAHRLAEILHARNISGILVCPQPRAEMDLNFDWDAFSAITFGYSLSKPRLHTVASAHYLNTRRALQILAARGYERIGMVIDEEIDKRCGSNVYAGYLIEQTLGRKEAIPPLFDYDSRHGPSKTEARKLVEYIKRHRLDVILTSDYRILENLRASGVAVPDEVGVASISLPSCNGPLSGIVEDCEQMGSIAVDLVVGMMHRGERGIPQACTRTHLEGIWYEGETVRPAV